MSASAVIGVDIGTSSSKGVLLGSDGTLLCTAFREHSVSRPFPGHVEMPAEVWWDEFVSLARELTAREPDVDVVAVGVSGMGPCVLLLDEHDEPVRPAILYGIDTRSVDQIARLERELGADEVRRRCGSGLTTQAAGPKIAWMAEEEPDIFARARRFFMPSSFLVRRLTGRYVLDHHSASQCTPLYDTEAHDWYLPWVEPVVGHLGLPELLWPGDQAGTITPEAAAVTGLPAGIPVVAGTIDAWSEALSVDAQGVGDLMVMYGSTMFLVHTVAGRLIASSLWSTVGARPGTYNLAGGMATSGAITGWLRHLFGSADYESLLSQARDSGVGSNGLVMLPYFAGERSPLMDPDARGVLAGLTLSHTQGDIYRSALEATAFGVRHNLEAFHQAGGDIRRVVAVGGGTQGDLWLQIVSDVTGLTQEVRKHSVGASYGAALLAAELLGPVEIDVWNPVTTQVVPDPEAAAAYSALYPLYRDLYPATAAVTHALARWQQHRAFTTS